MQAFVDGFMGIPEPLFLFLKVIREQRTFDYLVHFGNVCGS